MQSLYYALLLHFIGLVPKLFETFMAVRALVRFAECSLLLWKVSTNGRKWAKQVRNQTHSIMIKIYKIQPPSQNAPTLIII